MLVFPSSDAALPAGRTLRIHAAAGTRIGPDQGAGVPVDYANAMRLYTRAAVLGDGDARVRHHSL
jgi:TPR repeat protein